MIFVILRRLRFVGLSQIHRGRFDAGSQAIQPCYDAWYHSFMLRLIFCILTRTISSLLGGDHAVWKIKFLTVRKFAWRHANTAMWSAIIRELCLPQTGRPVVLLEITVATQVMLQSLILSLRLSVCLRVKGCRKTPLDSQLPAEFRPERARKTGIAIRND